MNDDAKCQERPLPDVENRLYFAGWFSRCGIDPARCGLDRLTLAQLDRLAGAITSLLLRG